MVDDLYTLPQIAEDLGVNYRTLHSWVERGLIQPSGATSTGTSKPNLFTSEDRDRIAWLCELSTLGLGIEALAIALHDPVVLIEALHRGGRVFREGDVRPLWEALQVAIRKNDSWRFRDALATFPTPKEWI